MCVCQYHFKVVVQIGIGMFQMNTKTTTQ